MTLEIAGISNLTHDNSTVSLLLHLMFLYNTNMHGSIFTEHIICPAIFKHVNITCHSDIRFNKQPMSDSAQHVQFTKPLTL